MKNIRCNVMKVWRGFCGYLKRVEWYFEDGGMVLWRGWCGALKRVVFLRHHIATYEEYQMQRCEGLKRVVWLFKEGWMVLWRGWYGTLKRMVWYFEEGLSKYICVICKSCLRLIYLQLIRYFLDVFTIWFYLNIYTTGASTIYGPHTLDAYRQEFSKLATALATGTTMCIVCMELSLLLLMVYLTYLYGTLLLQDKMCPLDQHRWICEILHSPFRCTESYIIKYRPRLYMNNI